MQYYNVIRCGSNSIRPQKATEKDDLPPREESKFRLNGTHLLLIYKKTFLSKYQVLSQLNEILFDNVKEYVVSEEKQNNGYLTIQMYLRLNQKMNILALSKFDLIELDGTKIEGEYKIVNDNPRIKYSIRNRGNFLTNIVNLELAETVGV